MLDQKLLAALGQKFQVRLYRFGKEAERIQKTAQLTASEPATRIGDSLQQVLAESSTLPLGAVVLLSDGADNSGGIDLDTISQIRRRHIPVHTIGFGREKPEKDVEITDAVLPAHALADSRLSALVTFRQYGYAGQKALVAVRDAGKVIASREVQLKADGAPQSEPLLFNAGLAGPEDAGDLHRSAARRRESRQQLAAPPGRRGDPQAAHPLYGRRAALGIQIHPPRRGRRPQPAACLHAAHHPEQDLQAGLFRSARARGRIPRPSPKSCSLSMD